MRRILLVIDDYSELVGFETLFRRLGFDVLSLGRDATVGEAVLGFPPDLVIATAHGRNVDGLKIAAKMRQGSTRPKLVVLLRPGLALTQREISDGQVDATIETPFEPRIALKAVCRLLSIENEPVLEKYAKIVSAKLLVPDEMKIIKKSPVDEPQPHATGGVAVRPSLREEVIVASFEPIKISREDRYNKYLQEQMSEDLPPMADASQMRDAQKKLAVAAKTDSEKLEALAKEKREFVRAMMKTNR